MSHDLHDLSDRSFVHDGWGLKLVLVQAKIKRGAKARYQKRVTLEMHAATVFVFAVVQTTVNVCRIVVADVSTGISAGEPLAYAIVTPRVCAVHRQGIAVDCVCRSLHQARDGHAASSSQ